MRILSIQVGKPKTILFRGKEITTSIFKEPISSPLMLRALNIDGDEQADLRVHGGQDKALYAYPHDAYPAWRALRPHDDFEFGAMGENLSVESLPEDQICLGDTFKLGDSTIQVTQPRFPCYKLSAKFNDPGILKQFMGLNRPGIYFRVLKEGMIDRGESLTLIAQESVRVPVLELFKLEHSSADALRLREILRIKSLTESWRIKIESWLQG